MRCIPPPPNPRHSRAGGSPGSVWIPACAFGLFPVDRRNVLLSAHRLNMDAFRVPLKGAEQRRRTGGSRLALSEPQASSGKPPGAPSSARNPEGAPTLGSPFLWLLSFGEAKESTPASKAEPQAHSTEPPAYSTDPQESERKTSAHVPSTYPATASAPASTAPAPSSTALVWPASTTQTDSPARSPSDTRKASDKQKPSPAKSRSPGAIPAPDRASPDWHAAP
jgi:hypothetical protein